MSALHHPAAHRTFPAQASVATVLQDRLAHHKQMSQRPDDPAVRDLYAEVGARIREARESAGWSRERLATELHIGFKSIVNYENGVSTLRNLSAIAEVLGVPPRWLLHGPEIHELVAEVRAAVGEELLRARVAAPESALG